MNSASAGIATGISSVARMGVWSVRVMAVLSFLNVRGVLHDNATKVMPRITASGVPGKPHGHRHFRAFAILAQKTARHTLTGQPPGHVSDVQYGAGEGT